MHSTGSVLLTLTEQIRFLIDEPDLDAKFTDDYLVRFVFPGVMEEVLSRINMMADNPIRLRHSVTLVSGQETYLLPPSVRSIYRVSKLDTDGNVLWEVYPRGEFSPRGPGWQIQGNELTIRPYPSVSNETIDVSYIPTGDVSPVYVSGGGEMDAGLLEFTLSSTPADVEAGAHDRRPAAYDGSFLRLLTAGEPIEERIISSHDEGAGTVTVRTAFVDISTGSADRAYEVVPFLLPSFMDAIAVRCAMRAGISRKISQVHRASLIQEYSAAVKTAYDNTANLQGRMPDRFDDETVDSAGASPLRSLGTIT